MTEIVVHESIVYRAERDGESCHFGTFGAAKAWAGEMGTITPINLRRALLRQVERDVDKDIEIHRLRGYLQKISTQTDQQIVWLLVKHALDGESLDYAK